LQTQSEDLVLPTSLAALAEHNDLALPPAQYELAGHTAQASGLEPKNPALHTQSEIFVLPVTPTTEFEGQSDFAPGPDPGAPPGQYAPTGQILHWLFSKK
jgi:hypothetical protein